MAKDWEEFISPNTGLLINRSIYRQQKILDHLKYDGQDNILKFNIPSDKKTTPFDAFYEACYENTGNALTQIENSLATNKFCLYTIYPGLLCGSGYTHDTGSTGDFKIGFFFDHTTGQPVIPGSSVKGVLRQFFELDRDEKDETDRKLTRNVTLELFKEFFKWILKEKMKPDTAGLTEDGLNGLIKDLTAEKLNELKMEIFGHQEQGGKDLFFDAVIDKEKTGSKKYLSNDFITPHKSKGDNRELDPFSNPTPLMFLKVLPDVAFEFRFKLNDAIANSNWNAKLKTLLFKELLLFNGVGAKTNVGYGQFVEKAAEGQSQPAPIPKDETWVEASTLEKGGTVIGTVRSSKSGNKIVHLHIQGHEFEQSIGGKYKPGEQVQLKITHITKNKDQKICDIHVRP